MFKSAYVPYKGLTEPARPAPQFRRWPNPPRLWLLIYMSFMLMSKFVKENDTVIHTTVVL